MTTTGYIHSIESFGTVDGPGTRYVVFFQGCPMRCLYCHNPDTWALQNGKQMTVDEILEDFSRKKSFYKDGGITCSGGEPLLQIDFLIELFKRAKELDINTCLDTCGVTFNDNVEKQSKFDELMKYTDLVMLDIKHIDPESHKILTGKNNSNILKFAKYVDSKGINIWIRHVVVRGFTNGENGLRGLGTFLATLKNIKALDVLPYHTMGISKYHDMGIEYPLAGMEKTTNEEALKARNFIIKVMKEERARLKAEKK